MAARATLTGQLAPHIIMVPSTKHPFVGIGKGIEHSADDAPERAWRFPLGLHT